MRNTRSGAWKQAVVGNRVWWAPLAAAAVALTGCDGVAIEDEGEVEDLTIVVEADKSRILEEEESLNTKREAVAEERERLENERTDVVKKLASLSKKDKKARAKLEAEQRRIDTEEKKLRNRVAEFESERDKLTRQKNALLERIATLSSKKGGLTIEQREEVIARRERDVARREKDVAERERKLAGRERDVTKNLGELAAVLDGLKAGGGVTKTVYVSNPTVAGSGNGASKTQVTKQNRQIRSKMSQRGILMEDLPPTARSLNQNAQQALGSKDYSTAQDSLNQLEQIVEGISINRDFVQAKFMRLSRAASNKKLDDSRQKKVQGLLNEVSESFNDGRYDRANRKANQIAALLK